ncbi:hypothetical protein ABPG72_022734 [Tetrahymena utriculariae]
MSSYINRGPKDNFNKQEYRKEIEDELKFKSNFSQYQKDIYEKEQYIKELEGHCKDLKTLLGEYKKIGDEKEYQKRQREIEIENLNMRVLQLENKLKLYEDNELAKQRIIDSEVEKEKLKNQEIVERFNQKFTFFEEQIQILEGQLLEKNRYILELETQNKDLNFFNQLVEEKQTLIESLRRENQVLIRRIREQFRDETFGKEKFDFEEERKFIQEIIKKKEQQGLFADGFVSNHKKDSQISESVRQQQNVEQNKRYRNEQIQQLSSYNNVTEDQKLSASGYRADSIIDRYEANQSQKKLSQQFPQPSEAEKEEIRKHQERLEQLKLKYRQSQ